MERLGPRAWSGIERSGNRLLKPVPKMGPGTTPAPLAQVSPPLPQAVRVSESPPRLALSVAEAAASIGVSERHLRTLLPEVPHVYVGGRVVIQDGRLMTMDEAALLDQILDVVPQFQKDLAAIRARVDKLQPYLQEAHRRIWAEDVGIDRLFHDPNYPRPRGPLS